MAESPAIEILSRWMFDWCVANVPPGDESVDVRVLARALCDPTQHGPLANPEFVMKLPGHSPSCVHVKADKVTIGHIAEFEVKDEHV